MEEIYLHPERFELNLVTGSLGGTIQVYKPPENGVGFTITLPRTTPERSLQDQHA